MPDNSGIDPPEFSKAQGDIVKLLVLSEQQNTKTFEATGFVAFEEICKSWAFLLDNNYSIIIIIAF